MEFSFDTIQDFDEHIQMSIPDYDHLNGHIKHFASFMIKRDALVYDVGCSTGKLINEIAEQSDKGRYIGIDKSHNVLAQNTGSHPRVELVNDDLTTTQLQTCDVVLSIFTLQFLQGDDRELVIKKIYDALPVA